MTDDPHRHLDDPFLLPDDCTPIPGTCSRCGQPAYLGTRRWWHLGEACRPTKPADFLPDPPTPEPGLCDGCGAPYSDCAEALDSDDYDVDANGNCFGLCCEDCWHPAEPRRAT